MLKDSSGTKFQVTKRILTVNRHEAYLLTLSQIGHRFDILTSLPGQDLPWRYGDEELPENLRLLPWSHQVHADLLSGVYEVLIVHTIKDLLFFRSYGKPDKVFVMHIALYSHRPAYKIKWLVKRLALQWAKSQGKLRVCATSAWKGSTWKYREAVTIPTPPLPTLPVQHGSTVRLVSVGNHLASRREVDFTIYEQLSATVPVTLIGHNPGQRESLTPRTRQEYLQTLQDYHVFVFLLRYPWEDGYNLALLEAMQAGMAIVSMQHPHSLVEHEKNGYLCQNVTEMGHYLQKLQQRPELVRQFGQRSQEIVRQRFSTEQFISQWNELLKS